MSTSTAVVGVAVDPLRRQRERGERGMPNPATSEIDPSVGRTRASRELPRRARSRVGPRARDERQIRGYPDRPRRWVWLIRRALLRRLSAQAAFAASARRRARERRGARQRELHVLHRSCRSLSPFVILPLELPALRVFNQADTSGSAPSRQRAPPRSGSLFSRAPLASICHSPTFISIRTIVRSIRLTSISNHR